MDAALEKALGDSKPSSLQGSIKFLKTFIYGEYGTGKTVLAASLVQNKGLVISTDSGTDSLFNHPELLEKIDMIPYQGLSQLTAIGKAITEGHPDYVQYDTVWVDTISQVQEEYLDFLNENFTFSGNHRTMAEPRDPVDT